MQRPLLKTMLLTLFGMVMGASSALAAETMGPVTDEIGVVKIKQGEPIFIGGYWCGHRHQQRDHGNHVNGDTEQAH